MTRPPEKSHKSPPARAFRGGVLPGACPPPHPAVSNRCVWRGGTAVLDGSCVLRALVPAAVGAVPLLQCRLHPRHAVRHRRVPPRVVSVGAGPALPRGTRCGALPPPDLVGEGPGQDLHAVPQATEEVRPQLPRDGAPLQPLDLPERLDGHGRRVRRRAEGIREEDVRRGPVG
eukprot:CAMPEP_0194336424 /NCGR_PEP_ID=MMETSP0171-20130528/72934_1 /TAXON_ID=218684 /ORGANISM="Corethron pennatum, Strain L29A3" /LENGTH=172 /DNA_ID=CAMNT_0039099861 /DNA_START=139 /DNA_END=653 /DNA_ORIENTATION=-